MLFLKKIQTNLVILSALLNKGNQMKQFKAAFLSSMLAVCSGQAMACGDTPFIGEICTFAFSYCPQGFVNADGRLLPLQQNQALYALLGTRYGGDGKTTVGVPNLTGRSVVGTGVANPAAGISAVALASTRGTETAGTERKKWQYSTLSIALNISESKER